MGKQTQLFPRTVYGQMAWGAARHEATVLLKSAVRRMLKLQSGGRCSLAVESRSAGMWSLPERLTHSDPCLPRLMSRGHPGFRSGTRGSKAQPLHRITQPKGACPSWANRSESKARSYAACPGSGTGPSRFLGTKRWKKPDNRTNYCRGAALLQWFWSLTAPIGFSIVTTLRQEFTGVSISKLSATLWQLSSIPQG